MKPIGPVFRETAAAFRRWGRQARYLAGVSDRQLAAFQAECELIASDLEAAAERAEAEEGPAADHE